MKYRKNTDETTECRKLSEELTLTMIEQCRANPQVIRLFTTKIAIESILGSPADAATKSWSSGSAR